jgi:hypothetical protein
LAGLPRVVTFDDAVAASAGGTRHVLLGNGFSIACRPDLFAYQALLDSADFSKLSVDGKRLFDQIGTTDFEEVVAKLRAAGAIARLYAPADRKLAAAIERDAGLIKEALAEVLAQRHPEFPAEISDAEYESARRFLSHFDRFFSLNYDLLLYWTVMSDTSEALPRDDGFRAPDDAEAEYVVWDPTPRSESQRVHYLHGALHLFDTGSQIEKYTWSRTGIRLITQVRDALARDAFPLVVTEGESAEKFEKILHNAYLNHSMRSFSRIGGSLFIFGHSLAENDAHILDLIPAGRLTALYISVRGKLNTPRNRALLRRAQALVAARTGGDELSLIFFDADSARVWQ